MSRPVESAEDDVFSESDIKQFYNLDIEARDYCLNSDEALYDQEDNFLNSKKKIEIFLKSLQIPQGEDALKSSLYFI